MLSVAVAPSIAERLNTASANRRWFPFDDDVIDWSVPLSDEWAYMPDGTSIFHDSAVWDRLDVAGRAFVERWEMTQLMRNIAHGEHLLNQGILAMLWSIDPYDPSYRYLLHEVAEECQHMAMFNAWVRLNDDIDAPGAGEESWGKGVADFTEDLAVRLPCAFWVNVLLFEFVGDDFNDLMRRADGRALHPILAQMGHAHVAEEARHIAYARHWLREGMGSCTDAEVAEIQGLTQLGAQALIDRGSLLPIRWSAQLEPYLSHEEFREVRAASLAGRRTLRQLKDLLDEFEELRIVNAEQMRAWETAGAFD